MSRIGNQKHYRANPDSPVFAPLRELILKTSGLADVLREALTPLVSQIRAAFVFGSIARGEDSARSDIDLLIVSESLTVADLFKVLDRVTKNLGREVNSIIHTPSELVELRRTRNRFISRVMELPKIWLIGGPDDVGAR